MIDSIFSSLLEASLPQGSASGKTHYTYAEPKLRNDAATQWVDWKESGSYWTDRFELVPLNLVEYKKWNTDRYDSLMTKMSQGLTLDPVTLALPLNASTYSVSDGNHRCAVSATLGYTHVPAVVSVEVAEEPPYPGASAEKKETSGRELFFLINSLRNADRGPEVQFQWKSAQPNDYSLSVVHDDGRELEVVVMRGETRHAVYIGQKSKVVGRMVFSQYDVAAMTDFIIGKIKLLL